MKILILQSYYNRPILLRNAISSILAANEHHQNWEIVHGDDGSAIPGRPIVESILKDHLDKITFVRSDLTIDDKLQQGLLIGRMANDAIKNSNADIALVLCDDDELCPEYLKNLSDFYEQNEDVLYAYSKIHLYNPLVQSSVGTNNLNHKYNQHTTPIEPAGKVDISQVSWRLDCCNKFGAWFQDTTKSVLDKPWIKDTDKGFFENLYEKCGDCFPTGIVGQYKGIHDYQLLWHKNARVDQLRQYDTMYNQLGGIEF